MKPKVVVFNNGTHHGADPEFYKIVKDSPELEDIWAVHKTLHEYNTDERMIANLTEEVDQRDPHRPGEMSGSLAKNISCVLMAASSRFRTVVILSAKPIRAIEEKAYTRHNSSESAPPMQSFRHRCEASETRTPS